MSRAGNHQNLTKFAHYGISNPKPDLHNINAHTKFGENPLMFTQVIIRKHNTDRRTQTSIQTLTSECTWRMYGQTDACTTDRQM